VDIEPRVAPGEKAFRPFRAQKLLTDKIGENLAAEKLSQPRVIDLGDLMEDAGLIHSALGHQEMEVRVDIYEYDLIPLRATGNLVFLASRIAGSVRRATTLIRKL